MVKLVAGDKTIECGLVVFDKDGTLVDQYTSLLELAKARLISVKKHGGEKVAEQWEKAVGVDLKNGRIDQDGPLATAPRREELLVAATAFYSYGFSWNEARQAASRVYDDADASMHPPYGMVLFNGVEEALTQLSQQGLRLAIASTDTHRRTEEAFKTMNVLPHFDAIVGSDDVASGKPSPDMIHEVLKKTCSTPDETVMVGDSTSDMQMGRNARVKACIGVLTGFTPREKLEKTADVVVSSVTNLRALE
jgi:phosphoglycolate phosphatase